MAKTLFLFPLFLAAALLGVRCAAPDTYRWLVAEDAPLEYAQAILFGLAALSALRAAAVGGWRPAEAALRGLFGVGLFFVAMEEISWGQRLLDLPSPAFFATHNVQQELSLHNLPAVHHRLNVLYLLAGGYGAFAWILRGPLLDRAAPRWRPLVETIVPKWFLSPYFLGVFALYGWFACFGEPREGGVLQWRDQEAVEFPFALGVFLWVRTGARASRWQA